MAPQSHGSEAGGNLGSSGSLGGDYQQYMKQYAGDYQKYMKGSQGSSGSQGGDYQQYMKQYAGDYQKYMKQGSQGSSGSQGGDYQQYMKSDCGGSGSGEAVSKSRQGSGGMAPMMLADLAACTTKKCVEDWNQKNRADVKNYVPKDYQKCALASINEEYEKMLAKVTHASEAHALPSGTTNASELTVLPPMLLISVASCTNKKCVEEWRNTAETDIKMFAPKDYQHFPLAAVEKEYKKNLARVDALQMSNATKVVEEPPTSQATGSESQNTFLAANAPEPRSNTILTVATLALLSLVVAGLYSVRFRVRQRTDPLEEDFLQHEAMLAA